MLDILHAIVMGCMNPKLVHGGTMSWTHDRADPQSEIGIAPSAIRNGEAFLIHIDQVVWSPGTQSKEGLLANNIDTWL